ncbi:MAG: hypothetical protein ACQER6_06050 [Pseudomonadota bacterium]
MRLLTLLSLLFLTTPILAGGQATIRSGGSQDVTIAWDADRIRLDMPDQDAYMLVLDGKGYSVSRAQGRLIVMDLSSVPQMPQGSGGQNPTPETVAHITRLENTGKEETIAGIEGEVYEMAWVDGQGNAHEGDAVLTDDKLVREMQEAFWAFSRAISKQDEAIGTRLRDEGLATLRVKQDFVVEEIRAETRPAEAFELPAEPMDMQQMMRGLGR